MPLNILWGYVALEHVDDTPHILYAFWFLGGIGTFLTLLFTLWHFIQNHSQLLKILDDEGHAITPFSVQMQQTINAFPVFTAGLAYLCLFVPAAAYSMELCIAIFASTVLGSLTQSFLHALGPPPGPRILTYDLPKRRWWCGSLCGGVNDPLPGMGIYWSREAHNLTLRDLRFAFRMVNAFIFTFIVLATVNLSWSIIPRSVEQGGDGWCYSLKLMKESIDLAVLIFSVTATLVGSSGLSIITEAVALALGEDDTGKAKETMLHVRRKSLSGQIYLQLPLLKVLLSSIRIGYAEPKISVPITLRRSVTSIQDDTWEVHGRNLHCPVYDQQVMSSMLYCTLVTLFMAYTSYLNFKLYVPADRFASKSLLEELEARLNLRREEPQDDDEEPLLGTPVRTASYS